MKRFLSFLPLILALALVALTVLLPSSCANTSGSPGGGRKDSIPPVITWIDPLPGSVNVPLDASISITFNEFVTIKDSKSIVLSPPQSKTPTTKMRARTIIVSFEEDLLPNTTYTLDLTNAIADNNEGNLYPGFTLAFSTGPTIDSMAITGTVLDCNTLNPIQGATVMLYKDHSDSALFKHRPDAVMKTDEWGYFALRNIQDTLYRLYAIVDAMNDYIYDPQNDQVAFADSLVSPTIVVNDTLKELLKYDMKDTVNCMARNSEYELLMFTESTAKQMIKDKGRVDARSAYISFTASDAQIDSLWIGGLPFDRIITQFSPRKDSLEIWVNDRRPAPDTLHIFVDYMKTDDSTGVLTPYLDHLKLPNPQKNTYSKSSRRDVKHEDTTCVLTLTATAELVEQYGFGMEFKYPIIYENFDSMSLISLNPKQQESLMKFTVERDSTNLRKYSVKAVDGLQQGYEYTLKIPHRMFRDINGHYSDSASVSVSLPKDDKLASLTMSLSGVRYKYLVELLDESRKNVLRSYVIDGDRDLLFPYLKAGKYTVRFTQDINRNGVVDSGILLEHKQPEKVMFYKLKDGSYVLDIPEGMDITQTLDLGKYFED